jgi:antitoxin component HigA of HigAB toxin-antitoxin module
VENATRCQGGSPKSKHSQARPSRNDLVPLLGTASRVSEVMNGKRELSMTMVKKLRERFNVSADLLISAVPASRSSVAA